jgi:hypothetical protein
MNVKIGGRSQALYQRDGTGRGFSALEAGLLDQKRRDEPVDDLQTTPILAAFGLNRSRMVLFVVVPVGM